MSIKLLVLKAIAESGTEFISGELLAEQLNVSRNSVWKSVKALEAEGFLFEAQQNKGYRISAMNNRVAPELIAPYLNNKHEIIVLDKTDSTNRYAKDIAAAGAASGTVVIADTQTSGRGRLGRTFVSPAGTGVYLSLIIRPKMNMETAQLITACTACAAADAVEKLSGHDTAIKWVNDLYMNGKKICGILTEASLSLENKSVDYAVIGIGINVLSTKSAFEPSLSGIASSIEDSAGVKISRNRLCAELVNNLEYQLANIENKNFLNDYRRREMLTGNPVNIISPAGSFSGKALYIDDNAALAVQLPDGSVKKVISGEASARINTSFDISDF